MKKTKGIVIMALGDPNYGRMAFNLAVSIKHMDKSVQTALLFAGQSLNDLFRYDISQYFDKILPVPAEAFTLNGKTEYLRAKTYLYELSPFDETLFLDADMLWHPRRSALQLFKELSRIPLTFENRDSISMSEDVLPKKFSLWADINDIKKAYGLITGKFYNLQSEFIWFKKTAANEAFFDVARDVYDSLKVKSFEFNGAIADELPFAIAMMMTGIYPHKENYVPAYFDPMERENIETRNLYSDVEKLFSKFWLYSAGGSYYPKHVKDFYNNLAKFYFYHEGLQYPYQLIHKREFNHTRKIL